MKLSLFAGVAAATAACAAPIIFIPAACADTAILVGVNKYPKLPARNQLEGCVNDAQSMEASLKNYGFDTVVVLTDGEATHDGILRAIKKSTNKPNERFVFGFFGHGTNDGGRKAVILPSDASLSGGSADIDADALRAAVAAVPASSRTIILDSCFSGGMLRSVKSMRPNVRTRFVQRPGALMNFNANRKRGGDGAKDLTPEDDGPAPSGGSGLPCYVVAASQNQPACEDIFDGKPHGVFTATLTKQLNTSGIKNRTWGEVITDVRAAMDEILEGTQKPEVSPSFAAVKVFGSGGGKDNPKPHNKPDNLWDIYNTDQRDSSVIQVAVSPDKTSIGMGERVGLSSKVGRVEGDAGYLVVIEKGTSGNINLLFPRKPAIADAVVTESRGVSLGNYKADQKGSEAVRAILFRSKEAAQLLLDAFKSGDDSGDEGATRKVYKLSRAAFRSALKKRDLRADDSNAGNFATADVTFEVVGE